MLGLLDTNDVFVLETHIESASSGAQERHPSLMIRMQKHSLEGETGTLHLNVRKVHRSAPIILMPFETCGINAPAVRTKCTQTSLCSQRAGELQCASLARLAAAW